MQADAKSSTTSVLDTAADLANGGTSSRDLIEAALAQIADPTGEGVRTFVKVYGDSARAAADARDRLRKAGYIASPLAGLPVSLKDLFDVSGEHTLADSKALDDNPPAAGDAPVVSRLRAAGAVLIGRTNMTEFAFSGVGINPHYGTPGNPYDRRLIPGGSSSGAAVSVSDGGAVVGIGTDTGGSVRIPAALCGIVGFKPTQKRIPRNGVTPLSTTLDSIGGSSRNSTAVEGQNDIGAGCPGGRGCRQRRRRAWSGPGLGNRASRRCAFGRSAARRTCEHDRFQRWDVEEVGSDARTADRVCSDVCLIDYHVGKVGRAKSGVVARGSIGP